MWLSEIANALGGRLLGDDKFVFGIEPLFCAEVTDLSLVIWPKDIKFAKKCRAGGLILELDVAADFADLFDISLIVVDSLKTTFSVLADLIEQGGFSKNTPNELRARTIDKDAMVHPSAVIGKAHIGAGTAISAGVVIHDGVHVGAGCRIGANSVIGAHGFIPYGVNNSVNLQSLRSVFIDDQVQIGSLCTVDAGLLGNTHIKKNTMIDNMVHVGHDVVIGENVVIAAQSGFAGFVRISEHVTIGGQVGVAPHVLIGTGARISGKSMVHCDIKPYEIWSGNPSVPHSIYLRAYGRLMNTGKKNVGGRK